MSTTDTLIRTCAARLEIQVLALAANTQPDHETSTYADEAARILGHTEPAVIRPLFAAYCHALTHLEAFGAESASYRDQHFGYPTPSHDLIARRLDTDARTALAELLAAQPVDPPALGGSHIEAYHEAVGCHLHKGPVMPEGVCCVCVNEDACEWVLDQAASYLVDTGVAL